ncbi:MAG: DUF1566 domain-containing protein [Desulfuromonadaceae bacterium]|nr:DUF1566 domain-containing protein [Desulfuromonadaceae bacterium]
MSSGFRCALCCMLLVLIAGCSKKSALEGKLLDAKGQPAGVVKVVAKPVKDGKEVETTVSKDGSFKFKELTASTEYEMLPYFDANIKARPFKVTTAQSGQLLKMEGPQHILFVPIKDGLTARESAFGIIWMRDAGKLGKMNWENAMQTAKTFSYAGLSDWRLPTKFELTIFARYIGPKPSENLNQDMFQNVQPGLYWSSDVDQKNNSFAWAMNMADAKAVSSNKNDTNSSVILVHTIK